MLTRFYHQLCRCVSVQRPKSKTPDLTAALSAEAKLDYRFALSELERVLVSHPDYRACHVALGRVLAKSGQMDRSIKVLRLATTSWPKDSELHLALGNVLYMDGSADEAISHFRSVLSTNPSHIPALVGIGNALREIGQIEEAHCQFSRAADIAPHIPEIYDNLGLLLQDMGQLTESIEKFEKALSINPSLANAKLHLGISRLLAGDFEQGWTGYETRSAATLPPTTQSKYAQWEGQNTSKGTLHILAEQGLGDEIMFASCIPEVLPRAQSIVVECSPKLAELFQRSFPTVSVVKKSDTALIDQTHSAFGFAIPIGSLGSIFRKTRSDFPAHKGYLVADSNKRHRWREKLLSLGPGLKVGIAWSGGTRSTRKTLRSIPLAQWDVLLRTQGVHFISLQYTECIDEIAAISTRTGILVQHWQAAIDDYDETAALVCELDFVISVQTAVVHLAGALGTPAWAMVPACPEWRYLREGTTLPWYPSVRLFRQRRRFEWQDVITDVQSELAKQVILKQITTTNAITLHTSGPILNLEPNITVQDSTSVKIAEPYKEAMALVKVGDLKNALARLEHGARINPFDAKISLAIANVLHLKGDLLGAISCYRRVILDSPNNFVAYSNLGNSLRELGRYDEAIEPLQRALDMAPSCVEAAHNIGLCYKSIGKTNEAIVYFKRALSIKKPYAAPLRALFEMYRQHGDIGAAINLLKEQISQHGEFTEAVFLLGLGYFWSGDLARSELYLRRVLALDQNHSEAWDGLGVTVQDAGRHSEAIAYYTKSIEINPKSNSPRWHRALARLALGDFLNGWEDYEFRPGISESLEKIGHPRWNGETNKNSRLIILPEQGLGDEIMFSSCVPDAAKTVGQTVLVCSPKLVILFARSFQNIVVTTQCPTPHSTLNTVAVTVGSLPFYFLRKPEDFALRRPYLTAHPSSVQSWRYKLSALGSGLKIGISWQGGTALTRGSMRSLPLSAWIPILLHRNAHFVSLQYTPCDQELEELETNYKIAITHWQEAIDDYDQTAALITGLDLVISVQTAVVHLSGALGVPTWVIVPARPEWRYGYNQNTLPWYTNVSVIRQKKPNDWSSAIEEVEQKLKAFQNA